MAVSVASFLVPRNNGKFSLLEDIYLRGGFRIVGNVDERNTMHPSVKKARMVVITADDGRVWQLLPDMQTWAEFRAKTNYFPFFTHDQPDPDTVWQISHNRDSKYFSYTLFDDTGEQVIPDKVVITGGNTVEFHFNVPVGGHATFTFAEQS